MAVHEDSSAIEKKSTDASNDLLIFNADNLQSNMKIIYYSRTFVSIIGGVVAGIMGLTGLMGFVFYFLIMAITSLGLMAKTKFSVHEYFDCWNRIIIDGFLGGLMSFVLFWTLYSPRTCLDVIRGVKIKGNPSFLGPSPGTTNEVPDPLALLAPQRTWYPFRFLTYLQTSPKLRSLYMVCATFQSRVTVFNPLGSRREFLDMPTWAFCSCTSLTYTDSLMTLCIFSEGWHLRNGGRAFGATQS